MTSARYCEMLETFLRPKMEGYAGEAFWFQQDGATAHTASPYEGISHGHPAPQISVPATFFMWGYLKAEVYKFRPRTLEALKVVIEHVITGIPQDMLASVTENFVERLNMCIARQGSHMNDIIFKT